MYFSSKHIAEALTQLKDVHPFHGITFMACKMAGLPVGLPSDSFSMDAVTREHMGKHHRLDTSSTRFYQPFKSNKRWLATRYPSSGLQAINTQTFENAFVHRPNSNSWAWSDGYIDVLASKLPSQRRIPVYAMCVWLYRRVDLPPNRLDDLIDRFLGDYRITSKEQELLFDFAQPLYIATPLQEKVTSWEELSTIVPPPPDAAPERGGRLAYLRINGAGPMPSMAMEPAERLTLVAGDNGLGKTFLLDCAWWALTGSWASVAAAPREDSSQSGVSIEFTVRGTHSYHATPQVVRYDWTRLRWQDHPGSSTVAGLVVYACVDGSFAVWDPAQGRASVYSRKNVWEGVTEGKSKIEGLIRDWRNWQSAEDNGTFDTFRAVLGRLSPSDLGVLSPGPMTRIPDDRREIPTIEHRYGRVPIVYASAAVKRVLSLAYLMVWAWSEHRIHCQMAKRQPERRMVILVDEIEAHLHPRWQRQLLPALVSVIELLAEQVDAQLIVSTHSPLVMASSETMFSQAKDALLHLQLENGGIELRKIDHMKYGKVDRWLMSEVFQLVHPRSKEAEEAIERAKQIQRGEELATASSVRSVSDQLRTSLADDDDFWPRWVSFAERYGVEL